jgi:hypothetical protein
VPVQYLLQYIAYLHAHGIAPSTTASYLAGISYCHKLHGWHDCTKDFLVQRAMLGMRRIRGSRPDERAPITIEILNQLPHHLTVVCSTDYEACLFTSVYLLAFFGFFRVGELVITSAQQSHRALYLSDISMPRECSDPLVVVLRYSKTDQLGKGVTIYITQNADPNICPVIALKKLLALRPLTGHSLFCHKDGRPLTRYQFSAVLKKVLLSCGITSPHFASHSFRIGACTTARLQGVPEHIIQQWGRWKSSCYQRYIRI